MKNKIVCLGFQKTGTSSITVALESLGYKTASYNQFRDLVSIPLEDLESEIEKRADLLIPEYDAFQDTPWPILYKQLDNAAPNCKFILVTRDEDKWIRSVVNDFGNDPNVIHEYIYGYDRPLGNESAYIERYRKHNSEVKEYFANRSNDFLHLHLDKGEVNWENICPFIDIEVPDMDWPHVNTQSQKKRSLLIKRWKDRLKNLIH